MSVFVPLVSAESEPSPRFEALLGSASALTEPGESAPGPRFEDLLGSPSALTEPGESAASPRFEAPFGSASSLSELSPWFIGRISSLGTILL